MKTAQPGEEKVIGEFITPSYIYRGPTRKSERIFLQDDEGDNSFKVTENRFRLDVWKYSLL